MLVPLHPFIINPSFFNLNALSNAIASTGCAVTIDVIYVQWWLFNRRRNLQNEVDISELFKGPGFIEDPFRPRPRPPIRPTPSGSDDDDNVI